MPEADASCSSASASPSKAAQPVSPSNSHSLWCLATCALLSSMSNCNALSTLPPVSAMATLDASSSKPRLIKLYTGSYARAGGRGTASACRGTMACLALALGLRASQFGGLAVCGLPPDVLVRERLISGDAANPPAQPTLAMGRSSGARRTEEEVLFPAAGRSTGSM
eukprot:CAMPEP_0178438294 /NCGR_PEP_ID=MMETSP0689_2-20121128/35513_1 /TAXON_ID=160604 /ORGANISM="Amphidinium massartii, Strain CS-259" /LENGTH=166 /DNA_ID=CAMNT_0020060681 /DNA_START=65 /DNA_END=565 /DNA_ORIENTATION=+